MTRNNWILTYSGRKFYPLAPQIDDIDIVDIAKALSQTCRWSGHVSQFYSVAEHSTAVSDTLAAHDREIRLIGHLHDASEAYLNDIARPVKYSPEFYFYREAERVLQDLIYNAFGIKTPLTIEQREALEYADDLQLAFESLLLMPRHPEFRIKYADAPSVIKKAEEMRPTWQPLTPHEAESAYLRKFTEIFNYQRLDDFTREELCRN